MQCLLCIISGFKQQTVLRKKRISMRLKYFKQPLGTHSHRLFKENIICFGNVLNALSVVYFLMKNLVVQFCFASLKGFEQQKNLKVKIPFAFALSLITIIQDAYSFFSILRSSFSGLPFNRNSKPKIFFEFVLLKNQQIINKLSLNGISGQIFHIFANI